MSVCVWVSFVYFVFVRSSNLFSSNILDPRSVSQCLCVCVFSFVCQCALNPNKNVQHMQTHAHAR